jgi:hypothetical protein
MLRAAMAFSSDGKRRAHMPYFGRFGLAIPTDVLSATDAGMRALKGC